MTRLAVWAPTTELMEVVVDGEVIRMRAHPNGWWSADAPDSGPGRDYLCRIDVGDARPDPRSNFQPQGSTRFLEQPTVAVKQLEAHLGQHLIVIAESDVNDPRVIHSRKRDSLGFHAQWNDDFNHAIHTALTGESYGYCCDFQGLEDWQPSFDNRTFLVAAIRPFGCAPMGGRSVTSRLHHSLCARRIMTRSAIVPLAIA